MGTTFYDLLYEYFDWIAGVIVVGGLMLAGASLIGLLAVGLAVVVPWRRGGVPRCGKCGYPVTGVAGWTCPECGSDYRSMGIIAPHHRRLVHPLVTVPLFSFFLAAPATMVAVVAIAVGPTTATYTDNVDLVPKADAGYEQIQLYAHSARGGAKHTAERIDIHIETEPSWYIYEVDYGSMTYVEQDAAIMGTPGLPFSRAGLEQMYVDAGVDITKPEFIKGIDEIWPISRTRRASVYTARRWTSLRSPTTTPGPTRVRRCGGWWSSGCCARRCGWSAWWGSWLCTWRGPGGRASRPRPSGSLLGSGV